VTIDGRMASPPPASAPARRRWLLVAVLAWALVVGGTALWSAFHNAPTAREQTTVAQALPTVDAAIADVVIAADPTRSVAAITGYTRLDAACRVTTARSGSRFERAASIYTTPGTEAALLDRIAAGLPSRYQPKVRHGDSALAHSLTADAGLFVSIRAAISSPGTVRVAADTGCRPQDRPVSEAEPTETSAGRTPVQAVFTALRVPARDWHAHRVPCRSGGALWTVEAIGGPGSAPASLHTALQQTTVLIGRADLYVYLGGAFGVVVRTTDGVLDVAVTMGCG
jgi:hypothetical protein